MKTTLYKKDSKENIREISYWTEGSKLCQSSGLVDGKLVENKKVCKGKNIGRSNETTPEQQAILERDAKIKKKLSEDYFKNIQDAQTNVVILPMLAKKYQDYMGKIDWTQAWGQPKLDGMRCLAHIKNGEVILKSREGNDLQIQYGSLQHVINALKERFSSGMERTVDGELYIHGVSFQDTMKLIKKYRKGESETIQFHIYDRVLTEIDFKTRTMGFDGFSGVLQPVRTRKLNSIEDAKKFHEECLMMGYEGSMIRWGMEGYKVNGRSEHLLKYKDFKDLDAYIVDIVPSDARPDQGVVVCRYNGKEFRAFPKMSHDDRKKLLKDKAQHVGKTCIVEYFEFTDDGIPRFPIFKGVRLDNPTDGN